MRPSDVKDSGYYNRSVWIASGSATAGGSGDNTAINGAYLDKQISGLGTARSIKVIVAYDVALGASETLTLAMQLQDADDGSGTGVANVADTHLQSFAVAATVVATVTGKGTAEFDLPLHTTKRYIRAVVTPNLSRANTDTAALTIIGVFGGFDNLPASKSLS